MNKRSSPSKSAQSKSFIDGQQKQSAIGGKIIVAIILYFMILFIFSRLSSVDRILEGRPLWPIFVQAAIVTGAALFALNYLSKLDANPKTRLIVTAFMLTLLVLMGIGVFALSGIFSPA